jgi:hypothetical protein
LRCSLTATAQTSRKDAAELEIRETIVRFQIKVWELLADSYCISTDGKDPHEEFLKRSKLHPAICVSG